MSVVRSATWIGVEAAGGALFSSLALLIIAGLIGPSELGLSAIALGIMQTVNFFPDTLFYDAIIQRRRLTSRHVGAAFWSVAALSAVLGGAVALLAPLVGRFYREPQLSLLLLALSASCLPTGLASIQCARLRRAMRFRALAMYALVSRGLAAAAGLILAIGGYGAWAVIAQSALVPLFLVVSLLLTSRWRFIRQFSLAHARSIGTFALSRTAAHFLDVSRGRVFFMVLGHYLPLAVLGQVNFAFRLADSLTTVLTTAVGRLCLPLFARLQADPKALTRALLEANLTTAIFLLPLFTGLVVLGANIFQLFGGERWQAVGPMIPWLSVAGMAVIIGMPALTGLLAIGRPFLVSLGVSTTFVAMFAFLVGFVPTSGQQAVIGWSVALCIGVPADLLVASKAMRISVGAQLNSLAPGLALSACVASVVMLIKWLYHTPSTPALVSAIVASGVVYLSATAALMAIHRRRAHLAGVLLMDSPAERP